jgi:hypothetical protein
MNTIWGNLNHTCVTCILSILQRELAMVIDIAHQLYYYIAHVSDLD